MEKIITKYLLKFKYIKNLFFTAKDKFFKNNNFIFIEEKENKNIIINKNKFKIIENQDFRSARSCIISDSLLELKVIRIPVVSKSHLKNIIINTLKKHSTIKPNHENTDYIILGKEQNQLELLTFTCLNSDILHQYKNKFTLYHVIDNLIKGQDFPDNCSFITNIDNIWFLYTFKNKKFINRHIYYNEDISTLKKKNIYNLDFFNERKSNKENKFLEISDDKLTSAFSKLKKYIFKNKNKIKFKRLILYISSAIILFTIVLLQIYSIKLDFRKNILLKEADSLNRQYEDEKAKRGIRDEIYKEYLLLFSKKSNTNEFLTQLYAAGKDNIEIERFSFNENNFSISGFCRDDSRLENAFRLSHSWKGVEFIFTKKNNKIQFIISGKFINES